MKNKIITSIILTAIIFSCGSYGIKNVKETFWGRDTIIIQRYDTLYMSTNYKQILQARALRKNAVDTLRMVEEAARTIDVYEQSPEDLQASLLYLRKLIRETRACLQDTNYLGEINQYEEGYEEGYEYALENPNTD